MASKKLIQLTEETPSATGLLYWVKNPGGTPLDRKTTVQHAADALAPLIDITTLDGFPGGTTDFLRADGSFAPAGGGGVTIGANQVAYAPSANTLGGDAGFTFDPTAKTLVIGIGATPYGVLQLGDSTFTTENTFIDSNSLKISVDGEARLSLITAGSTPGDVRLTNSGGTIAAPTATSNDASLGDIFFQGYDGSDSEQNGAAIGAYVDGAVGMSSVPSIIYFSTGGNTRARIGSGGGLSLTDVMSGNILQTGAGDVVFGTLAGTGTRTVVVDANGKLSAP